MTDNQPTTKPCARGCTYPSAVEGEDPKPRPAMTGGLYCKRCFHATKNALTMTGGLVEHTLSLVNVQSGQSENESSRTKGSPPLPFNLAAFGDANEIYSRLVYWARVFAELLSVGAPSPAENAWADLMGSIRGLPYDVSPATAKMQTQAMSMWLEDRLEMICAIEGDDIAFFLDDMKDLYRTAARWPMEEKPQRAQAVCPGDCGGKIMVYPPVDFGEDQRIVCNTCGRHFGASDLEHEINVFKQATEERDRAEKAARHLAKKYAS